MIQIKNQDHRYLIISGAYLILIGFFLKNLYYNDSAFPFNGHSLDVYNNYSYLWSDRLLGADTFLEKLRGLYIFFLNQLEIFNPFVFFSSVFLIGFYSAYKFLSLLSVETNKRVILSIFFVLNPFTLNHLSHFLLLQGYYITPLLLYFYYQYIIGNRYINGHLLWIIVLSLFLGQPHNYANLIIMMILLNILIIGKYFRNIKNYFRIFLKNLVLLLFAIASYSFFILTFIGVGSNNSLLHSSADFGEKKVNNVWSLNNNLTDFFQIINYGEIAKYLFHDPLIINLAKTAGLVISGGIIYVIFNLLFTNRKGGLFVGITLVFSIFLVLIHKFGDNLFGDFIYKIMPHIAVSTNYAIPIFIIALMIFFSYSNKNKFVYSIVFAIQIMIFLSIISSDLFKLDKSILEKYHHESIQIKNDARLGYELLLPLSAKYKFPGLDYPVNVLMLGFDNFSLRHITLEQVISSTRKSLAQDLSNTQDQLFLSYPFKYFVKFGPDQIIDYGIDKQYLEKIDGYEKFEVYKNKAFLGLMRSDNLTDNILSRLFFKRTNPTKYNLKITNLTSKQNLAFLESFHNGWHLYMKGRQDLNQCIVIGEYTSQTQDMKECKSNNTFYQGEELDYLFSPSIFKKSHQVVSGYANGWTISKDEIISHVNENYSKEIKNQGYPKYEGGGKMNFKYYTLNPDGSIDIEFTLYFKPQSYFYLGLIISGTTLILLIGYLGYTTLRRRG